MHVFKSETLSHIFWSNLQASLLLTAVKVDVMLSSNVVAKKKHYTDMRLVKHNLNNKFIKIPIPNLNKWNAFFFTFLSNVFKRIFLF